MRIENVADAERASRARATVMALAAVVLLVNVGVQFGDPAFAVGGGRSASWLVLIGLWLLILATGGALTRASRARTLMNDELSLQNRSRAIAFGFYTTMLVALAVYLAGWFRPVETHDAIRMITAGGIAGALGRYAWLEMR